MSNPSGRRKVKTDPLPASLPVVLGVPFGAGPTHVMEFGPVLIEQASGYILQDFAQVDHHLVENAPSSSLSHDPLRPTFRPYRLPVPSFVAIVRSANQFAT